MFTKLGHNRAGCGRGWLEGFLEEHRGGMLSSIWEMIELIEKRDRAV